MKFVWRIVVKTSGQVQVFTS